jgi:hypothetical protein
LNPGNGGGGKGAGVSHGGNTGTHVDPEPQIPPLATCAPCDATEALPPSEVRCSKSFSAVNPVLLMAEHIASVINFAASSRLNPLANGS